MNSQKFKKETIFENYLQSQHSFLASNTQSSPWDMPKITTKYSMQNITHFDAVKILFDAHVMSLIDASVFISARASHVKLHNLIKPPRHVDKSMSEYIVIPDTQPL